MLRVSGGTDREPFYWGGQRSVREIEAVLAVVGRTFDSYPRILDFGCGCGRIMLWLEHVAKTCELHGTDVDRRAVQWAAENLPWATFKVNQPRPPLDYPDATFDLVFNHSVFTHLDEEHQDLWLSELRRVTKPGGHLVLSVHGEEPLAEFEEGSRKAWGDPKPIRDAVRRDGIAFIDLDSHTGGPFPGDYHTTFHAPWYVFDHWSRWFTIKAYVPRGSLGFQDFVLLERPPADQPVLPENRPTTRPLAEAAAPADLPGPRLPGVQRLVAQPLLGPPVGAPGRFGPVTRVVRRVLQRVLSYQMDYHLRVERDVQQALREVDASLAELAHGLEQLKASVQVDGVLALGESNVRLWDSLKKQGERVNRLENDLWDALAQKADRPDGA